MKAVIALYLAGLALAAQQPDPDWQRGLEAHKAGKLAEASALYRAYLRKWPKSFEARANLGVVLAGQGLYEEAIVEYRQALQLAPTNPGISFNLALAHYKSGDFASAAKELSALRALVGEQPQVTLLLGDTYLQLGENAKAIGLLEGIWRWPMCWGWRICGRRKSKKDSGNWIRS
jgi:tetratricopeptide (TPR) repeat protein